MIRLAAALTLVAAPASALSCLPPDAVRLYSRADESIERFALVIGRLAAQPPIEIPVVPMDGSPTENKEATTRVRMTGQSLGARDFSVPFDLNIDVHVTCLSIWCGDPVTDREILAALRLTNGAPVLEVGPCGGNAMPLDQADLDALLACHRSGNCSGK